MRFLKIFDGTERTYDSCLPSISDMLPNSTASPSDSLIGDIVDDIEVDSGNIYEQDLAAGSEILQFPFRGNPKRRIQLKFTIVKTPTGIAYASYPETFLGITRRNLKSLLYRTRYTWLSSEENTAGYQFPVDVMFPLNPPRILDLRNNLVSSYVKRSYAPANATTWEEYANGYDINLDPRGTSTYAVSLSTDQPWNASLYTAARSLSFTAAGASSNVKYGTTTSNIDDHKMVDNVASPTSDVPFSISVTFKTTKTGGGANQIIAERFSTTKREWELYLSTDLTPRFRVGSDNTSNVKGVGSSTPISDNEWVHMVATYNGDGGGSSTATSSMKIYVNGQLLTDTYTNGSGYTGLINTDSAARLWVGAHNTGGAPNASSEFEGLIWTLNIWKNRELTADEVLDLYSVEMFGGGEGWIRHRVGPVSNDDLPRGGTQLGPYRYGISNIEPEFNASSYRIDHYGYFRDALEQRKLTATSDGFNPIKIRFMSGSTIVDPMLTYSQNLSTFATSSMPYFDDDVTRNRPDNPDETLVEVIT